MRMTFDLHLVPAQQKCDEKPRSKTKRRVSASVALVRSCGCAEGVLGRGMSEGTSTEPLPVAVAQEYRVKLGQSFTFPHNNAFHTLKYDFKPLSVDSSRPGHLKITEEGAVNVSLPVGQSESGDDFVQFRGPKKSCAKECILIINRDTGEAILERISDTVQLKATRDSRKHPRDRSVSPSPFQAKATPPKQPIKSSLSQPHLNPSTKQHANSASASNSAGNIKSKQSSSKQASKQQDPPGGRNSHTTPKLKGADRLARGKLVKSNSQPVKGQNSLYPKSGGIFADIGASEGLGREISPLRSSANPTPEPGALPSSKKPKLSSSSLSSSSSSGSDSDSMEWENVSHPAQKAGIPPSRAIHVSYTDTLIKENASNHTHKASHSSQNSSTHSSQNSSQTFARSSSAGRPDLSASKVSHVHFLDEASARLLSQTSSAQAAETRPQLASQMRPLPQHHRPISHPRAASSSSSSSETSSSGSSSSDSSSDSDEENDREVAHAFSQPPKPLHQPSNPPKPVRQMSMSLLRSDLNLSESGSDSDM